MNVDGINPANGKIDLNALTDALAKVAGGTDGNGSVILDGDNVVITTRDADSGEKVTRTLDVKMKDDMDAAAVANWLDQLADAIDAIVRELKGVAKEVDDVVPADGTEKAAGEEEEITVDELVAAAKSTDGSTDVEAVIGHAQKTFFSIYELINLMQEIAQEQRNNARQIRYTELQTEIKSIQNQADAQRRAAKYGMIVSAVTCAVQGCMIVGTTVASVKGLQAADKTGAAQELGQAKQDMAALDAAKSPEASAKHLEKCESKCSQTQKDAVEQRLNEGCGKEKSELALAKEELSVWKGIKVEKEAQLTEAQNKLDMAESLVPRNEQEITNYTNEKAACEKVLGDADKKIPKLQEKVNAAKLNYEKALTKTMNAMDSKYSEAAEATKSAEGKYVDEYKALHVKHNGANQKSYEAAQGKQAELGNERALLKARVTQEKAALEMDGDGFKAESLKADAVAAHAAQKSGEESLRVDKGYRLAMADPRTTGLYAQTVQMVGTMGQSLAHLVQTNEEAKGTEEQANQKTAEQFRDETNQLFQQAQSVVDNVRALFEAVIQAEAKVTDQIVRC